MDEYEIGDLVEAIPPHWLVCGGGIYSRAVVVSIDPFVLVSEDGDMMWEQMKESYVRRIGKAFGDILVAAMSRFLSGI